jgi:hypothetical protein
MPAATTLRTLIIPETDQFPDMMDLLLYFYARDQRLSIQTNDEAA